jgi:(p)ppGpp synthase/HD superfamily hydrolase
MLDKAIAITATAFEGTFDKGGAPYIRHCLHVMHGVRHLGDDAMMAAVMHDLIEDTDYTATNLLDLGFSHRVVSLVVLLTHLKGEEYTDYVMRISVSPIARAIKMADLRHNSDIHRMKGLTPKDFDRLVKYHTAYALLSSIVD